MGMIKWPWYLSDWDHQTVIYHSKINDLFKIQGQTCPGGWCDLNPPNGQPLMELVLSHCSIRINKGRADIIRWPGTDCLPDRHHASARVRHAVLAIERARYKRWILNRWSSVMLSPPTIPPSNQHLQVHIHSALGSQQNCKPLNSWSE